MWPYSGASHCVKSYVLRCRMWPLLCPVDLEAQHILCAQLFSCACPLGWPWPSACSPLTVSTWLVFQLVPKTVHTYLFAFVVAAVFTLICSLCQSHKLQKNKDYFYYVLLKSTWPFAVSWTCHVCHTSFLPMSCFSDASPPHVLGLTCFCFFGKCVLTFLSDTDVEPLLCPFSILANGITCWAHSEADCPG